MKSGVILLGVVAGVAAGALLGVLLAPDKGRDTRKKVIDKKDEFTEGLKEKFNEFLASVGEKFDKVKGEVSGISINHTVKPDKARKDVKPATD